MDRAIAFCVLLLVGLTWLLYKLTILLEPRAEQPPASQKSSANSSQKLIHQRLR